MFRAPCSNFCSHTSHFLPPTFMHHRFKMLVLKLLCFLIPINKHLIFSSELNSSALLILPFQHILWHFLESPFILTRHLFYLICSPFIPFSPSSTHLVTNYSNPFTPEPSKISNTTLQYYALFFTLPLSRACHLPSVDL